MIFNVCLHIPYSKDSRNKQREQILWGLQYLFWPARARLLICAADSVSSPHPLNRSASFLRLRIFHCPSFSILLNGFERRRTCLYCYMCAPFFTFILTQVFTTFHICASFFSFFSFFFIVLFLYLILYTYFFHRPQLYSSPQWSGANVCSPQSSHYNCSCKLEELPPSLADIITAFYRKPSMFELRLLPSTVWEWIKLSPRVHLLRESKIQSRYPPSWM